MSRYLIRVESIYWRENWTFVSVTLTIFLIICSVSFSQCTMSPMLGLLFRSAWMQSSAISIALFTWWHSASSDVHLGVSSSLFLQFSSTYGFDKKYVVSIKISILGKMQYWLNIDISSCGSWYNSTYKVNKFLGRHICTRAVAIFSGHYLYHYNTQAKDI